MKCLNLKIAISMYRKTKELGKIHHSQRAVSLQGRDFLIISPTYQKTQIMIHLKGGLKEKNRLYLRYKHMKLWWDMPLDFSMEEHPDLFKLAEFVLLSPFDSELLDGWVPSRKPGIRPGLAFSTGCDSTAAMELLPEQTVLMYHMRSGFDSD